MNWSNSPIETGWYAVYNKPLGCVTPRYTLWHCHKAITAKSDNKFLEYNNFSVGDLVFGFDEEQDLYPVNDFWTEGRKFCRLPDVHHV